MGGNELLNHIEIWVKKKSTHFIYILINTEYLTLNDLTGT